MRTVRPASFFCSGANGPGRARETSTPDGITPFLPPIREPTTPGFGSLEVDTFRSRTSYLEHTLANPYAGCEPDWRMSPATRTHPVRRRSSKRLLSEGSAAGTALTLEPLRARSTTSAAKAL